jgi:predicted adenylyl cyclase CyaB
MTNSDMLLTIKEAAEYLKVHWQTVRNYIRQRKLTVNKVGRNIRIRESDLLNFIEKREKKKKKFEVELRFVISDRKIIEKKLLNLGAKVTYHGHIIDHWYIPKNIKNIKQKDEWFDSGKGYGVRIREQDNGYTGKIQASLEVKKLLIPNKHDTCLEAEIDILDQEETQSLLKLMNFKKMVTVDKDRIVYSLGKYKIIIDDIKNFIKGIEIEYITDKDRNKVLKDILKVAKKLGIDQHKQMTKKSLTYLAMKKFAKF